MKAILVVMATGIVAYAVIELLELWRRYQTRKNRVARWETSGRVGGTGQRAWPNSKAP